MKVYGHNVGELSNWPSLRYRVELTSPFFSVWRYNSMGFQITVYGLFGSFRGRVGAKRPILCAPAAAQTTAYKHTHNTVNGNDVPTGVEA